MLSTAAASGQAALNSWRAQPRTGLLRGGPCPSPRPPSWGRGFVHSLAHTGRGGGRVPKSCPARHLQAVPPLGSGGPAFQQEGPSQEPSLGQPLGAARTGTREKKLLPA